MKITFNSNFPNNPTSSFYAAGFKKIQNISINDFKNYEKYNIALFPSYLEDLEEIKFALKENPDIKIGVVDPRSRKLIKKYLPVIDFFIVDSIEMNDFWLDFNKPVHTYYEYPDISIQKKVHDETNEISIGYHGNKVHLTSIFPNLTRALEILGEKYQIKLKAIYNIKELGKWEIGRPRNISIKDIQWSEDSYLSELKDCDIGIVPSLVPVKKSAKRKSKVSKFFLGNDDDYLIRFKMLSNPGRMIIFSRLHIPVVAEITPSHINFIKNGKNGFLAYSTGGWVNALEKLIKDHELRNSIAEKMFATHQSYFDHEVQNKLVLKFFEEILMRESDKENSLKIRKLSTIEWIRFNNSFVLDKLNKIKGKIF